MMRHLAAQYKGLSHDMRAQWNYANNAVQSPEHPANNTKRGTNGWTLFYACNSFLASANQPLTLLPERVNVPKPLLPVRVRISDTGGVPSILLLPFATTPYAAGPTIALWASLPVAQGNALASTVFKGSEFRFIGEIVGGLPLAGVDIAAQYLAVFGSVPPSCKIGFKLMAYNPGGYHTKKLVAVGLTPMLSLAGAMTSAEDWQLAVGGG